MPHAVVTLARQVATGSYPECIIRHALSIVKLDDIRRINITKLWNSYRKILREYRSVKLKPRSPEYRAKTRAILVASLGNYRNLHNDFHECMNSFSRGYSDESYNFLQFKSKLEAFECTDILAMLKYVECVNAERHDDTLVSVSFIHPIPATELTEIVLYRLNNL